MKANCIRRNNLQVIAFKVRMNPTFRPIVLLAYTNKSSLTFKAICEIKKGEELLWDYGPDYLEED